MFPSDVNCCTPSMWQIVEHVVLFKINPSAPPSSVATMLASLNGLSVSTTPLCRSSEPTPPTPTSSTPASPHMPPSDDFHWAIHPVCDGIMMIDCFSTDPGSVEFPAVSPGKAVKITLLKLKEGLGGEEGKGAVKDAIAAMKGNVGVGLEAVSFWDNFSPVRAEGFGIGSVAVFSSKEEMEAADGTVSAATEKVKWLL